MERTTPKLQADTSLFIAETTVTKFSLVLKMNENIAITEGSDRAGSLLAAILTAALYYARSFDAFAHPQFWAEDGTLLWLQQYLQGHRAIFLPYAGYLHVPQGLAAAIAALFDPSHAPTLYAWFALLFVVWGAFSVAIAVPNATLGFLLGASLSLAPHPGGEIFGNLINLQWFLGPALAAVLCGTIPLSRFGLGNQIGFVVLAGLSGPFAAMLLPVAVFRFVRSRHWLFAVAIAAGVLNLILILLLSPPVQRIAEPDTLHLIEMALMRCAAASVEGAIAAAVLIIASLVVVEGRLFRIGILLFALVVIIGTIAKFRYYPHAFDSPYAGQRYFYIPQLVLLWCAISLCFSGSHPRLIAIAALVIFFSLYRAEYFWKSPLPDQHWATYAEHIGKQDLTVPVNPGWSMRVPANPP